MAHSNRKVSWIVAIGVAILSAVCLIYVLLNRPYPVSKGADDLLTSIVASDAIPTGIVISNGRFGTLSRQQADGVITEVLRPSFRGWQIAKIERRDVSEDSGGVSATLGSPTGQSCAIIVAGKPSPQGPTFSLDALLRLAWQSPVLTRDGSMPEWSKVCSSSLEGLHRDRAKLEKLGIVGVQYGRQGPKTWDQLEAWFSQPR